MRHIPGCERTNHLASKAGALAFNGQIADACRLLEHVFARAARFGKTPDDALLLAGAMCLFADTPAPESGTESSFFHMLADSPTPSRCIGDYVVRRARTQSADPLIVAALAAPFFQALRSHCEDRLQKWSDAVNDGAVPCGEDISSSDKISFGLLLESPGPTLPTMAQLIRRRDEAIAILQTHVLPDTTSTPDMDTKIHTEKQRQPTTAADSTNLQADMHDSPRTGTYTQAPATSNGR